MQVVIKPDALRTAMVSAIHYSKNLPLTDFTSASMVINELKKCSSTKRLDTNQIQYRNDGHALKLHANSYELIVYDKLKDLFSAKIAKAILQLYWQQLTYDLPLIMTAGFKAEDIYQALQQANPELKPAKILQIVGALAVNNNIGMNGLRNLVESHSNARTWQRLKAELVKARYYC